MIRTEIDARAVEARLARLAPDLRVRAARLVEEAAASLQDAVKAKLSDEALNVRSGRLRDSIAVETADGAAKVFSDAPYARIQEYGGRIEIPEIVPVAAKVLAFMYDGKLVFARHVAAHAVEIPPRPYMAPALDEFADRFIANVSAAINEVIA